MIISSNNQILHIVSMNLLLQLLIQKYLSFLVPNTFFIISQEFYKKS